MVQKPSVRKQIKVVKRTNQYFTSNEWFQRGMKHARAGIPISRENSMLCAHDSWMYERGRHFVTMFPRWTSRDAKKHRNGGTMDKDLNAYFAANR